MRALFLRLRHEYTIRTYDPQVSGSNLVCATHKGTDLGAFVGACETVTDDLAPQDARYSSG